MNGFFLNLLVAALPVIGETCRFRKSFFLGFFIAGAFFLTASFFRLIRPLCPAKLYRLIVIVAVAAAVYVSQGWTPVTPLWGVSLWLLMETNLEAMFQTALGFWMLLAFLGISQEIFGGYLKIPVFWEPAGAFFLLAAAALFFGSANRVPGKNK